MCRLILAISGCLCNLVDHKDAAHLQISRGACKVFVHVATSMEFTIIHNDSCFKHACRDKKMWKNNGDPIIKTMGTTIKQPDENVLAFRALNNAQHDLINRHVAVCVANTDVNDDCFSDSSSKISTTMHINTPRWVGTTGRFF